MTSEKHNSRREIVAGQVQNLQKLLRDILPANRFYAKKLSALGGRTPASLEEFFEKVPFTTKQEIVADQLASPPYGTNLTFPLENYTRFHQTSGTSGSPLRWLDTPESWQWMVENWKTIFRVANVGAHDRVLFAFSFGPFIGFWLAYEAAQQLGSLCIPCGGLSSEARVRLLFDNDVTALCCTPTYAIRLAEVAAQMKFDLARTSVKAVLVAGEPGGSIPATRARLETLWPSARIFDHHGMTEVGPVTYECPKQPGVLHVLESGYIAEIVKPGATEAVTGDDAGELILTSLGRAGSPLIRYRTGDLVRPSASAVCACGREELALLGGILGRADDMVIVRGVNVYPSAIEDILRGFSEIAEYRVHVTQTSALTELSLEIEPRSVSSQGTRLAGEIQKALQVAFNLRIPVTIAGPGSLPRFEMKARRWVRN